MQADRYEDPGARTYRLELQRAGGHMQSRGTRAALIRAAPGAEEPPEIQTDKKEHKVDRATHGAEFG